MLGKFRGFRCVKFDETKSKTFCKHYNSYLLNEHYGAYIHLSHIINIKFSLLYLLLKYDVTWMYVHSVMN